LHGTVWRHAAKQHDLAASIAELREIADGRDDILAEAAGLSAAALTELAQRLRHLTEDEMAVLTCCGGLRKAAASTGSGSPKTNLSRRSTLNSTLLDPAVKARLFACDARMDGDISAQAPWTSELHVAATALLGVAWLILVVGLRRQLRTKAVAALPGLATLAVALAGAVAISDAGRDRDDSLPTMLMFSIELAAIVALVAISAWQPETHGRHIRRLVVVLWGTTAFGAIHTIAEYVAMIIFSGRSRDEDQQL
jgi:hypothetical protein